MGKLGLVRDLNRGQEFSRDVGRRVSVLEGASPLALSTVLITSTPSQKAPEDWRTPRLGGVMDQAISISGQVDWKRFLSRDQSQDFF